MKRRQFVAISLAALLPTRARSQSPRVLGLLWNDSVKPSPHIATLMDALRGLGWTSGRNLQVVDRVAHDAFGSLAEGAGALVKARCDVIATYGATATVRAAKATTSIPIAMLIGVDPVRAGLAASLPQPGGNITGVVTLSQGLIGKRLQLLKELAPGASDIGVLFAAEATSEGRTQAFEETKAAAAALKLNAHFAFVRTPGEIDAGLAGFAKARYRAVYISQGTFLAAHSERIARRVAEHRLVAVYPLDRFASAGGLLAYSPSASRGFVRLAAYIDRLLKGARPADTPIEQMSDVEMVINLKTARAQRVDIPQTILQRANRLIE